MPAAKEHLLDPVKSSARIQNLNKFIAWLGWAIAAGFAIIALWVGQLYFTTSTENALLRQEQSLANTTLHSAQNLLEAERILNQRQFKDAAQRIAQLEQQRKTGSTDQLAIAILTPALDRPSPALAVAIWDPSERTGILQATNLPNLPTGKTYRLRASDSASPPFPLEGGAFRVDPNTGEARIQFKADRPMNPTLRFTISADSIPASGKEDNPILLLSH